MKRRLAAAIVVTGIAAALGGGAYAARAKESDAQAIANAKISLPQAIALAEQSVGGKATKARLEQTNHKWAFLVEVVKDSKVLDVKVDIESGTVISSTEDDDEYDED